MLVDTAPYPLPSEGRIVSRCARAARGGPPRDNGEGVIFNLSCRDGLGADRVEPERLAREHALAPVGVDERVCATWDAPALHLVKLGPTMS